MDKQNVYQTPQGRLIEEENQTYQPKIFSAQGRIGRLRYLAYSMGINFAIVCPGIFVVTVISMATQSKALNFAIIPIYIVAFAMSIMFCKRRLNDLDRSGWLALLMLIPLINFIFGLYVVFAPGKPERNNYGLPPAPNSRSVVLAAWLVFLVPVIGIVAAITLPAYQEYVARAHAAQQH